MRILHLIGGGDVGGAKTHVISLAAGLGKCCDIKLISFRHGDFSDDAIAAGIDVEIIENRSIFEDYRQVCRLISSYKPDILHCHGARANLMGTLSAHGLPTVSTIHSDYRLDYLGNTRKQATYGQINRFCLRKIDFYTCVADRTARMMISRGFDPYRIFTIYNGLDFSVARPSVDQKEYLSRFGAKYEDGDVLCGIAARLTAVKDMPTLLRAAASAIKRGARLKLVIAGDGEDGDALKSLAKELNIENRTVFIGWTDDTDEFFSAMDINVICSLSETFPYSILEGVRGRCATVVSDVGGMPELIDQGKNGYIFKPRDYKTLGDYLYKLCQDGETRRLFADRLFEKASVHFSLDTMVNTQINIYHSLLKRAKMLKKRSGAVICGAYGKGNAGDDAILGAIVQEIRGIDPDIPMCVMSRRPKQTKLDYRVGSIFTFDVPKMLRQFSRRKLYINGGGSLIQDITSSRSLYFYLYTLSAARHHGAKVMMYGCGIGPITGDYNRKLSARVLNKNVDVITLREDDSKTELDFMGVKLPYIYLAADPALTLFPSDPAFVSDAFSAEGIPENNKYLCVCVRDWPGFKTISSYIAAAADYAYEKYGFETVILPIEIPLDETAGNIIASKMHRKPFVFHRRYDARTTIGIISRMECILSMRLHALVFAACAGVPLAGIAYDKKVIGFMKYMRQDRFCDMQQANEAKLKNFIDTMAIADRKALSDNTNRLRKLEHLNVSEAAKLLEVD